MSLQDPHLMPKHQQFDVAFVLRPTSGSEHSAQDQIEEREQHGSPSGQGERMLPVPPIPNRGN